MIIVISGDAKSHVVRGIAALVFGILALVWPGPTLLVLVLLFGAFALVEGVATIVTAFGAEETVRRLRTPLIIHGAIAVLAGIVTFVWPGITALALVYLIAFWALFTGFAELIDAYRLRHEIDNDWLVGIMGLLRVVFGAVLVIAPGSGALAITWLIGWFAILDGVLHLAFAWRLRKIEHALSALRPPARPAPA